MDRLAMNNRPPNKDQPEQKIMNPNFRRFPPPRIRHREQINPRNPEDQQIRQPFPENFVDEEEENDPMENQIHHFDDMDFEMHLTKEEHNMFSHEDECNTFELET